MCVCMRERERERDTHTHTHTHTHTRTHTYTHTHTQKKSHSKDKIHAHTHTHTNMHTHTHTYNQQNLTPQTITTMLSHNMGIHTKVLFYIHRRMSTTLVSHLTVYLFYITDPYNIAPCLSIPNSTYIATGTHSYSQDTNIQTAANEVL